MLRATAVLLLLNLAASFGNAAGESTPGEVGKIWETALTSGNVEEAERLTSTTSAAYIEETFGSLEKLSTRFQISENEDRERKIIYEEIDGTSAIIVYRIRYGEGPIKIWTDRLFREDGEWKLAPQFTSMVPLKD